MAKIACSPHGHLSPKFVAIKVVSYSLLCKIIMLHKIVVLVCLATAHGYTWPSPQLDALESMRWDQIFGGFVRPCDSFVGGPNTGRFNAADWIRAVSCRNRRGWGVLILRDHRPITTWQHIILQMAPGAWMHRFGSQRSRHGLRFVTN